MRRCSTSSILRRRLVSSPANCTTGIPVHILTTSAISSAVTTTPSCSCSACHSSSIFFIFSSIWSSCSRFSVARSYCWVARAASLSLRTLSSACLASFKVIGIVLCLILTLDAASSTRSIALSGRKRSGIYLEAKVVAALSASSLILSL
ncbi:hypothetical protein ES705_18868 [subsurface metagenome]